VRESIKTENAGRDGYPPGAAGGRDLYLVTKQEKLNKGGISKRKKEKKKGEIKSIKRARASTCV
jgi:hypothetical protein